MYLQAQISTGLYIDTHIPVCFKCFKKGETFYIQRTLKTTKGREPQGMTRPGVVVFLLSMG